MEGDIGLNSPSVQFGASAAQVVDIWRGCTICCNFRREHAYELQRIAIYYDDLSGFSGVISARGAGGGRGNGGAGTVFLKGSAQAFGDLVVDNGGFGVPEGTTPLRAIGPGFSTAVGANILTDSTASFPVPNSTTGALGLIGLELNPNTGQDQTFTIIDNTETEITTDALDGDMTLVASPGDSSIGVYKFDELTVINSAQVVTDDNISVTGTTSVDATSSLNSNNLILP